MIRTTLFTLTILLCCLPNLSASESRDSLDFSVSGYGKVFYEADTCDISFAVVTEALDARESRSIHAEVTAKIREWVAEELPADSIFSDSSTDLRIVKKNDESFYVFQTVFALRTGAIDRLPEIQEALVNLGVNRIGEVRLFSAKLPELEDRAHRLAIADAKSKAELAAAELGWRILGATDIDFGKSWRNRYSTGSFGSRVDLTGAAPAGGLGDEVFVDSTVTVTFAFEQVPR